MNRTGLVFLSFFLCFGLFPNSFASVELTFDCIGEHEGKKYQVSGVIESVLSGYQANAYYEGNVQITEMYDSSLAIVSDIPIKGQSTYLDQIDQKLEGFTLNNREYRLVTRLSRFGGTKLEPTDKLRRGWKEAVIPLKCHGNDELIR